MSSSIKSTISGQMKVAMKAGDKWSLAAIRQILAELKQVEVDERRDLSDADVLAVLDKMVKQRRESIAQFGKAGREDLVSKEESELKVIQSFLPEALTDSEIEAWIAAALQRVEAKSMRDMGKVMALLKADLQGRADIAKVSSQVKDLLSE